MDLKDFNYDLPEELIAQDPLEDRSSSRLMVLHKDTGRIEHKIFRDIIDYLNPGDCLVINDTKVIPARLMGIKEDTGAAIEVLLLKRNVDDVWECLVKPGKKARTGARIIFGEGLLVGEIVDVIEDGNRMIKFHYEGIFEEDRCRCLLTLHISFRIRTDTRQYMPKMKAQQRHLQPDCILQRSCLKRLKKKVLM